MIFSAASEPVESPSNVPQNAIRAMFDMTKIRRDSLASDYGSQVLHEFADKLDAERSPEGLFARPVIIPILNSP